MLIAAPFAIAVTVYSLVGILLARGRRGREAALLLAAVGSSWLCAAVGLLCAVGLLGPDSPIAFLEFADALRAGLWLWLAYAILGLARHGTLQTIGEGDLLFWSGAGLAVVGLALPLARVLGARAVGLGQAEHATSLGVAALGLVLVENTYKVSNGGTRWAVKHLLIALGGSFAFDLFRQSDALLLGQFSSVALSAQPMIYVLIAPLLVVAAARIRGFAVNIHVARRFVLQTTALVASGVYLLAIAAAGFVFRQLGADWAPTLQLVSLVGALLLLAVLASSGSFRARGRRLVERSFFSFAYDYREEWLRFVATMAGGLEGRPLGERAIKAAADPLDCSAGLLYLRGRDGGYRCAARWNWPGVDPPPPPYDLIERLDAARPAIDLRRGPSGDGDKTAPWPDRPDGTWILLGLQTHGRRLGALLLGQPRVSRELTWEDLDLLGVLAAQISGYIAEEQMTRALAEAQRFEQISKNFSFVAHDLKNIVSQLSILLQQAKRHGDKPEFVRDTLLTVGESVDKMRAMLLRLRESGAEGRPRPVDLVQVLERVVGHRRLTGVSPALVLSAPSAVVEVDPDMLVTVVGNLLDNAYDAGGVATSVELSLALRDDWAVLEVRDDGPGMHRGVVEDHLFRPFASTKATGYGIGLYQCREWVERWGGRLEIESTPGAGTKARVRLPLSWPAPAAKAPDAGRDERPHDQGGASGSGAAAPMAPLTPAANGRTSSRSGSTDPERGHRA